MEPRAFLPLNVALIVTATAVAAHSCLPLERPEWTP